MVSTPSAFWPGGKRSDSGADAAAQRSPTISDERALHEAESLERGTVDRGQQFADRAGAILAGGFGVGGAGALAHLRLHAIADAWTLHALIPIPP
jgi:hypothetical protein